MVGEFEMCSDFFLYSAFGRGWYWFRVRSWWFFCCHSNKIHERNDGEVIPGFCFWSSIFIWSPYLIFSKRFGSYFIIDSTHNTTEYGFKLITIVVVDKATNKGYPACYSIASKENRHAMNALFSCLRVSVRNLVIDNLTILPGQNCRTFTWSFDFRWR